MQPRHRNRAKGLTVDPDRRADFAGFEPPVKLHTRGQRLWDQLEEDPPFWLTDADLPYVAIWCAATDTLGTALGSAKATEAGKAALLKEWRQFAEKLGMTPQTRGQLKMTEAQSAVAAQRAKEMQEGENGGGRARRGAIPVDELEDDGDE